MQWHSTWLALHILSFPYFVSAVRVHDDLGIAEPGCGPCDQLCRKPHPSLQSIFVAPDRLRAVTAEDGRSATRYVVRSDHEDIEALCSKDLDLCNATLVPYVDALDPLNMSRLEIYVDPILEVQLRWLGKHRAWLCRIDDDVSKECVCQLTGHETHSSVLERFGALLPKTMGLRLTEAQLNLERRCPEPSILDGLCSTLLFLLLLIGALTLEALLALRHEFSGASRRSGAPDGEEAAAFEWPEDAVKVQSPSQNFFTGLGWSGGFVGCLVTLQTVTLSYVEKTDVPEQVDWAIMFFPCFLAVLGSYRLMKLLCKKQLTHFCLKRGVLLLDPAPSTRIDVMLLALLGLYGLLVLGCSFANPQAMVVVALLGPFWTLLKALRTASDLEEQLKEVEVKSKLWRTDLPQVTVLSWSSLLRSFRAGDGNITKAHIVPSDDGMPEDHFEDFSFRDLAWHRAAIWHQEGSSMGFWVLPSWAALVAAFLAMSLLQGTLYACSRGQLKDLQLVTDLHSLTFKPYQQRYVVHMDTSFTQVALLATGKISATRWISLQQPASPGPSRAPIRKLLEDESFASEEIQLSQALIPRVSTVQIQGLRPWLEPSEVHVRFSPLRTLPFWVEVKGADFHALVPWSTIPGSIISLPPGVAEIDLTVTLVDFYLGLPIRESDSSAHSSSLWTVFEAKEHTNNETCHSRCNDHPQCLTSFLGVGGCYFAYNNQSFPGDGPIQGLTPSTLRRLAGRLDGCIAKTPTNGNGGAGPCGHCQAEHHVLQFRRVHPDWQGRSARLSLALELDVGEQHFDAESGTLELHQGRPAASDAVVLLRGEAAANATLPAVEATLSCEVSVDSEGNVLATVGQYDPFNYSSLHLLVMPVVLDQAFFAEWEDHAAVLTPSEVAMYKFSQAKRCAKSNFLQRRYAVCSSASAPLKDRPIRVALSPWTGLEEPVTFSISLRAEPPSKRSERSERSSLWPPARPQELKVSFKGVDGPAAWAAQRYGCALLQMPNVANESVAASADALCTLKDCPGTCKLLKKGLGHGFSWISGVGMKSNRPLLSPEAIVQAMVCFQGSQCQVPGWEYSPPDLRLKFTGARLTPGTLVRRLGAFLDDTGVEFLEQFQVEPATEQLQDRVSKKVQGSESIDLMGLDSVRAKYYAVHGVHRPVPTLPTQKAKPKEEVNDEFYRDVAEAVWHVPALSSRFLVAAAQLGVKMPRQLLMALINKGGALPTSLAAEVHEAFQRVKLLKVHLHDAAQLKDVAKALQLARNLTTLRVQRRLCGTKITACPAFFLVMIDFWTQKAVQVHRTEFSGNIWPTGQWVVTVSWSLVTCTACGKWATDPGHHWPELCPHLGRLKSLTVSGFSLHEEICLGESLKTLDLGSNQISTLPTDIFQNLTSLTQLRLTNNQLSTLPASIFSQLPLLQECHLDKNKLTFLPETIFSNQTLLEDLNLQNNQLSLGKMSEMLNSLRVLYLGKNHLSSLPPKIFKHLQNLNKLHLQENQLRSLPMLKDLSNLHEVDIHENPLPQAEVEKLKKELPSLRFLRSEYSE
ncbi:unnamed protein product [Durusdinium trenchii]|uniref:Uncharacterized protein n=1 Tax=Durusdinium trenchii TaxID=1381693 RepID=A0ABP0NKW1_9DINO